MMAGFQRQHAVITQPVGTHHTSTSPCARGMRWVGSLRLRPPNRAYPSAQRPPVGLAQFPTARGDYPTRQARRPRHLVDTALTQNLRFRTRRQSPLVFIQVPGY